MLILSWVVVGLLLVLWSIFVWVGQLLLTALLGGASHLPTKDLGVPEAWTSWLPQALSEWMTATLEAAQPWLQTVVDQMPVLAGGIEVLAWVLWALGALLLVLAGGAAHVGVRMWQRSQAATPRATLIAS